jgi:DNA-binding CsgD family transcriptional regulator
MALTEREREDLIWATLGKTNEDIAAILGVNTNAVDADFKNIFGFFGVNSRVMAVAKALYQREVQFRDISAPSAGGGTKATPPKAA